MRPLKAEAEDKQDGTDYNRFNIFVLCTYTFNCQNRWQFQKPDKSVT